MINNSKFPTLAVLTLAVVLGIVAARIRVDGNCIYATTRRPETGEEATRVQIIRTLTAKELVLEDERGNPLKMERAE
jgi:hypothetical protein